VYMAVHSCGSSGSPGCRPIICRSLLPWHFFMACTAHPALQAGTGSFTISCSTSACLTGLGEAAWLCISRQAHAGGTYLAPSMHLLCTSSLQSARNASFALLLGNTCRTLPAMVYVQQQIIRHINIADGVSSHDRFVLCMQSLG
jgi:hypothetical protein